MTQLRWQEHVGFAVESSGWGVAATTPAAWVPVTKCDFQDDLKYYKDTAYRSVQAMDFGAYPTTGQSKFDVSCDMYVDTVAPYFCGIGMIGDNDTVSVVSGTVLNVAWTNISVNAHTFIIQPNGPKSLTWFDYNGYSERAYPGSRISDVTIKYSPEGSCTADVKGDGRLSILQNSTTVPQIGGYAPILGWQALLSLNGATNTRLIDLSLDLKRKTEVLFTQAQTQSPTNIYAFPLEVDGDLTVDFVDETEYNYYRTGNQSATFDIFFVSSSNNAFRITVPQPLYTAHQVDRSKDALTAKIKFSGIYQSNSSTNVKMVVYNGYGAQY